MTKRYFHKLFRPRAFFFATHWWELFELFGRTQAFTRVGLIIVFRSGQAGDAIASKDGDVVEEETSLLLQHTESETSANWNAPFSADVQPGEQHPDDPLAKQLLAEMMTELGIEPKAQEKLKRAEHKFQKKAKIKGRIKNKGYGEDHTAGGDGFKMGKKGGMMPASVQATVRSAITDE